MTLCWWALRWVSVPCVAAVPSLAACPLPLCSGCPALPPPPPILPEVAVVWRRGREDGGRGLYSLWSRNAATSTEGSSRRTTGGGRRCVPSRISRVARHGECPWVYP